LNHTFLWWVINSPQISPTAHTVIADPSSQILFSAASGWEIAIKAQLGKLQIPDPPESFIASQLAINSFEVLPIQLNHALQTYYLPNHHKDPFDRILVAQSQVENLPILSSDSKIAQYGVQVVW
jgi:PIN domain nuclease of toxin-antitoxin system